MQKVTLYALAVLACAPLLPAQTPKFVTSPKGFTATEGPVSFFLGTNRRYMGIDNTHVGTVLPIKSFGFRRDKSAQTNQAGSQDTTLHMGLANFALLSTAWDRNYLSGTKKRVVSKKTLKFPDWTTPTTTPAPFDFVVPLDSPFVYVGQNALVWDLLFENGVNASARTDRAYVSAVKATAASLGNGCNTFFGSFTHTLQLENNGPSLRNFGMRIRVGGSRAPANTPVLLSLAVSDQNLGLPGWCTRIHAVPLVILPVGTSTPVGLLADSYFSGAYDKGAEGFPLVTQLFAADASQTGVPVALSNGRRGSLGRPANGGYEAAYLYNLKGSNFGLAFFGGSLIVRLGL